MPRLAKVEVSDDYVYLRHPSTDEVVKVHKGNRTKVLLYQKHGWVVVRMMEPVDAVHEVG